MIEEHLLQRATILRGHVSADTAYRVDDYPYGFQLRCEIRYWLETATKGAKQGQVRFMSQTTNPRRQGRHWNKPKGDTYVRWAVLYLDVRGYVKYWTLDDYSPRPEGHLRFKLIGLYDQLNDDERHGYDELVNRRRHLVAPDDWRRTAEQLTLAKEAIEAGEEPAVQAFLESDREVVAACARQAVTLD